MTDVMASSFVDVHQSKAKLALIWNGNCFVIASTVRAYSLEQILLRVVTDGRTKSLRNALNNCRSSRVDIAFHEICAEKNRNMK
jgi:hypothetical protein